MKYLKTLGLVAVAAAALTVLLGSGTASATILCKEAGETCATGQAYPAGTVVEAQLVSGTKAKLETTFKTVECSSSTVKGETGTEEANELTGPEGTVTFGECNCEVKVLKTGTTSTEWISGTNNGTQRSNGNESTVTCSTIFGTVHCIYVTSNTDLGTLTGGNPAKLDANASIPRLTTNSLCSEKSVWKAEYEVTSPKPLFVGLRTAAVACVELNKNEGDYTNEADCTATRNKEPNQGSWERSVP